MVDHALWLVPPRRGALSRKLRGLIEDLAGRFGTPVFAPHVTLLGGLSGASTALSGGAERMARRLEPCEVRLGEIVSRDAYFRRLVSVTAPTDALLAARELAAAAFRLPAEPYWPHLSLAYGDLDPVQTASLLAAAVAAGVSGQRFAASTLELWRTEGPVGRWRCVASLRLGAARGR